MEDCGLPVDLQEGEEEEKPEGGQEQTVGEEGEREEGEEAGGGRGRREEAASGQEPGSSEALKRLQPLQGLGQCLQWQHLLKYVINNIHRRM